MNNIIQTIRDIALAVTAGAEVVEAATGVPNGIDTAAVVITLAAHVLLAALNAYQNQ